MSAFLPKTKVIENNIRPLALECWTSTFNQIPKIYFQKKPTNILRKSFSDKHLYIVLLYYIILIIIIVEHFGQQVWPPVFFSKFMQAISDQHSKPFSGI